MSRPTRLSQLLWAVLTAQFTFAHQQPTTLALLDVGSDRVMMDFHLPLTELELAFGHDVTQHPEQTVSVWGLALKTYLTNHTRPQTASGEAWSVRVEDLKISEAEQTQSGSFQEVFVHAVLI